MGKFIFQRALAMLLTLILISTATFFLMHAIPGGPFTREKPLAPEIIAALNKKYNLDAPVWEQYLDYMKDLIRGDLGPSFKLKDRTVNELIANGIPYTAQIGFFAIIITILISIPLGILSALRQNRWQDWGVMFIATLGVTIPSFVSATILIYIFCIKLGWFPVIWNAKIFAVRQLVLPVLAMCGYSLSFITRLMRSSMLDVLNQDYIRTARSKGISEYRVITRHALKNAILPVVTYVGPMIAAMLTGSFVLEKLFTVPGIGYTYVDSISSRDYTLIMGSTIFYAAILIFLNFIVDIIYSFIDPRIKFGSAKES